MQFDLIVVGGGAAGFFGAIQAVHQKPDLKTIILEKSTKVLSKVRISGGGRCNVTHHDFNPFTLARHYPRGEKALKKLFKVYHAEHVVQWFESRGVPLKSENDGRIFPTTNSSQTVIDCFINEVHRLGIRIETAKDVSGIDQALGGFNVRISDGQIYQAKKILIATGGNPKRSAYDWIAHLNHAVKEPIPSLFTFNDAHKKFKDLMGVSIPHAEVRIQGTKLLQRGPVLLTHWGLSGPAVIKLSAWAAEYLHAVNYNFKILVDWTGGLGEEQVRLRLVEYKSLRSRQKILSDSLFSLPQRLSQRLCELAEVDISKTWSELTQKKINKLVELLIRCPFDIQGKTTFKEEFVTCGGVELEEINLTTMESKRVKNIYIAGEVLNIDGETGGFNFQSAWTTAYIAATAIASCH
jgi:predicted Rossmann fold flavoprotein